MSHYKIINDENKLKEFIEWLPDTPSGYRFYLALFARKKYCREIKYIKTDKAQVARVLTTKKDLYNKIRHLEVPLDSYVIKDIVIPQESLALYISLNPRDLERATRQSLIKFAHLLASTYNGYNPVAEAMSEAHKACGKKIWFDFDFDNVDLDSTLVEIRNVLPDGTYKVMKTKNGFHVIVHLPSIDKKLSQHWYHGLSKLEGCDVVGDNLSAVPGCTQGGFTPYFVI
jgi:hypothetical protein